MSHLNVRGFLNNKQNLLADRIIKNTWIMCFTETFLNQSVIVNTEDMGRPDMVLFRFDRKTHITPDCQKGGGIMIAARKDLNPVQYSAPHDIKYLEYGGIQATINETVYTILCLYRRPQGNIAHFIKQLTELLDTVSSEQPTVILGDFNKDLSKPNPKIKKFLEDRGFTQFTSESTSDSGSVIDHTYFNKNDSNVECKVIDTFYSDHDSTCLLIPKQK